MRLSYTYTHYLYIYIYIYLSIYLSIHHLSIYLYLSIDLSIYLFSYLSIYLSLCACVLFCFFFFRCWCCLQLSLYDICLGSPCLHVLIDLRQWLPCSPNTCRLRYRSHACQRTFRRMSERVCTTSFFRVTPVVRAGSAAERREYQTIVGYHQVSKSLQGSMFFYKLTNSN